MDQVLEEGEEASLQDLQRTILQRIILQNTILQKLQDLHEPDLQDLQDLQEPRLQDLQEPGFQDLQEDKEGTDGQGPDLQSDYLDLQRYMVPWSLGKRAGGAAGKTGGDLQAGKGSIGQRAVSKADKTGGGGGAPAVLEWEWFMVPR